MGGLLLRHGGLPVRLLWLPLRLRLWLGWWKLLVLNLWHLLRRLYRRLSDRLLLVLLERLLKIRVGGVLLLCLLRRLAWLLVVVRGIWVRARWSRRS